MTSGEDYDKAYDKALTEENITRKQRYKEASSKPLIKILKQKDRDQGTGDEKQ